MVLIPIHLTYGRKECTRYNLQSNRLRFTETVRSESEASLNKQGLCKVAVPSL